VVSKLPKAPKNFKGLPHFFFWGGGRQISLKISAPLHLSKTFKQEKFYPDPSRWTEPKKIKVLRYKCISVRFQVRAKLIEAINTCPLYERGVDNFPQIESIIHPRSPQPPPMIQNKTSFQFLKQLFSGALKTS
jgi:hypothetical protein